LVVGGLIAYAIYRYRRDPNDNTHQEPAQVYGSNQIEIAWTVIPLLIVFTLTGVTARIIAASQDAKLPKTALKVTVIGHQWWWEYRYPDLGIVTANELHIPVSDRSEAHAVYITEQSVDVAHSFWVPQLSGKTDVIPNRDNHLWIDAHQPGVYLGNCTEYCGTQHANMLIRVIAQPKAEFDKWVENERRAAVGSGGENAEQPAAQAGAPGAAMVENASLNTTGQQPGSNGGSSKLVQDKLVFESLACVNCHTIKGTPAIGKFGPDLTHLASRSTIGSGVVPNTTADLRAWVDDPQTVKPGCLMPSMKLTDKQLDQVVEYLQSLK
jgi:cytochrome c oxidase subunit 2